MVARPLEQVLDEVEQRSVRPLHILEREHRRVLLGEPLEEQTPSSKQVLLLARLLRAQPKQLRQPRLDEAPLLSVDDVLLQRRAQLLQRGRRVVVLGDRAAHANHVRQRPVRNALAVGETAAAMPVDRVRDAVEVLVELPHQAGLADAGDARHGDEVRLSLLGANVEEILDLPELAVPADERRLETLRLQRATAAGDDAQWFPEASLAFPSF